MSIGVGEMDLSATRREYVQEKLHRKDLDPNPYIQFEHWYRQAEQVCNKFENCMQVATVDSEGNPDIRTVLLKGFGSNGFLFYTNLGSKKAQHIHRHPTVALHFHWQPLERQVIVRGKATPASRAEVENYFSNRPRGSQLGALVSRQSEEISSRATLEEALEQAAQQYQGKQIPVPDYWGGYHVTPSAIEFWQGQPDRLHDRFTYTSVEAGHWNITRLAP